MSISYCVDTLPVSKLFHTWPCCLHLTLKMTTAQVVETSVTVNNNSPIQDYVHPDDQTQPTFEMTPGLKSFTQHIVRQVYLTT